MAIEKASQEAKAGIFIFRFDAINHFLILFDQVVNEQINLTFNL